MWTKSRLFTSKRTNVLLTFGIVIGMYLILNVFVKSERQRYSDNLNETISVLLTYGSEEREQWKTKQFDALVVKQPGNDKDVKIVEEINNDNKINDTFTKDAMVCSQFSKWTQHLITPKKPTDLKNWSFKKTTECPKFSVDKYPSVRQKISLYCNGSFSKIITSLTTSTRDITSVEFGNICLSEVINNCCQGKQAVPNVVHYIWYANREFSYFHFISFMSVLRFIRPCLFLIHGMYIPWGKYWDYFVSSSPNIIQVVREKTEIIFGHKLAFEEHASDIMRIEALKKYGGVYLDYDEIVLRPLEPLRKYKYTQGLERNKGMGSQLILAKRNATFLHHWYFSYRDDYRKTWAWNAIQVPGKISRQYPSLIHVEGHNFSRPHWQQLDLIFKTNYNWSTNYAMHMYIRFYLNETNNIIIRTLNTTIGAVCRHVLFGNKELCVK